MYKLRDWIPIEKLDFGELSKNPNAIHILEKNLDKINWNNLCINENAIYLLEKNITEEFEYNSSQQLYISRNSWENVVASKNNVIQLMRKTYESLSNTASLQDFKTIFLMNYVNGEDFIANTIEDLRKDAILLS